MTRARELWAVEPSLIGPETLHLRLERFPNANRGHGLESERNGPSHINNLPASGALSRSGRVEPHGLPLFLKRATRYDFRLCITLNYQLHRTTLTENARNPCPDYRFLVRSSCSHSLEPSAALCSSMKGIPAIRNPTPHASSPTSLTPKLTNTSMEGQSGRGTAVIPENRALAPRTHK